MKKLSKLLVITAALTVIGAVPAMAQEVTDPATIVTEAQLIKTLNDHQAVVAGQVQALANTMADKNAANQQIALVMSQVQTYNKNEANNYINYLKKAIINLEETERIKKEVVDNYTNLAKANPQYAAMIPQAISEYNAAVAATAQWRANLNKAVADFAVMYR
ncbi:MAG: hypothetical protein K6E98_04080 [Lachnospiraceae bacterium]|nr:hypothetical protein [Lachnospiraceae bacterium]